MEKIKVYLASPWFNDRDVEILNALEVKMSSRNDVDLYSPRRDGIMLPPNQKHDTALREGIFKENISNILKADIVVANIDSEGFYNDPGTIYEIGYAMAHDIPVVGFTLSVKNIEERFKGILEGFDCIIMSLDELDLYLDNYSSIVKNAKKKVLFVGAGNTQVDTKLASYISEGGFNLRWTNLSDKTYSCINEIFENVEFMVAVIDDRKTPVSWMIGQAYARGIPVITYSDYNYGINVMLLVSVLTHIRGIDELNAFLQQVKRYGLESIPKFDISNMDSM